MKILGSILIYISFVVLSIYFIVLTWELSKLAGLCVLLFFIGMNLLLLSLAKEGKKHARR